MAGAACKVANYRVVGMDCADEVAALGAALMPLPGVRDLKFDILNAQITVAYDEDRVHGSDIEAAVARTGMRAQPVLSTRASCEPELLFWERWGRTGTTAISGLLVLACFLTHGLLVGWSVAIGGHETAMPLLPRILYLAGVLSGAWFILPKAWHALRRVRPDMNLLMTIAVAGAIGIGEYFEAATVAFLFALSLALEAWSVGRARRAISALLELAPPTARVVNTDGREQEIPVDAVPVGARIVLRPGERIPLDGCVVAGESHVNQASITGESVPVKKQTGSEVFAGAINGDGVNDAPALARANLGIAMGAAGADAAIETADVALMSDDLSRLPWLVRHARRTLGTIRQNISASLAVKAAFVLLAFSGHASLWAAIAADMGVSLLVVFNALRLLGGGTDRKNGT